MFFWGTNENEQRTQPKADGWKITHTTKRHKDFRAFEQSPTYCNPIFMLLDWKWETISLASLDVRNIVRGANTWYQWSCIVVTTFEKDGCLQM